MIANAANDDEDTAFLLKAFLSDETLLNHIKKKVIRMRQGARIVHTQNYRALINAAIDSSLSEIGIQELIQAYFARKKFARGGPSHHKQGSSRTGSRAAKANGVSRQQHEQYLDSLKKTPAPGTPERHSSNNKSSIARKSSGSSEKKSPLSSSEKPKTEKKFNFNQTYRFSPEDFHGLASPSRCAQLTDDDVDGTASVTSATTVTAATSAAVASPATSPEPHHSRRYQASSPGEAGEEEDREGDFYQYRNEFDEIIASPDPFSDLAKEGERGERGIDMAQALQQAASSPFPLSTARGGSGAAREGEWKVLGQESLERDVKEEGSIGEVAGPVLDQDQEEEQEKKYGAEEEYYHEGETERSSYDEELESRSGGHSEEAAGAHDEVEGEYSMGDFESPAPSPDKDKAKERGGEEENDRRVFFPEEVVSSTLYHRMKYLPAETAELFYTQDEALQFQFDYDREVTRAEDADLEWYEWIMARSEEQQRRDEEEDELLREKGGYEDYWEEDEEGRESASDDQSNEFW